MTTATVLFTHVAHTRNAWHITPIPSGCRSRSPVEEAVLCLYRDDLPQPSGSRTCFRRSQVPGRSGSVEPAAFHDYRVTSWPVIEAEMRTRATQTNEAGRCAVLLPVLAALPQPLALLDVGAYPPACVFTRTSPSYRYGAYQIGEGDLLLNCTATGMALPAGPPEVVWRAGLDLNPLDVTNPVDLHSSTPSSRRHAHRRARSGRCCPCGGRTATARARRPGGRPSRAGSAGACQGRPWWSSTRRCCTWCLPPRREAFPGAVRNACRGAR